MSDEVKIALIGSIAAILGALHLPKIYEFVFSFFSETRREKRKESKLLKEKVERYKTVLKAQNSELYELKNQINSINVHLNVIIPILMEKFGSDRKTVNLLKQLQNSSKVKSVDFKTQEQCEHL